MLTAGDLVPHFEVGALDGRRVRYADVWQRRNLLLVRVAEASSADAQAVAASLRARATACSEHDAECLVTADPIPGIEAPAAIVADRWGEIAFAAQAEAVADLPRVEVLVEWLAHVQQRCPECEGESR